MTRVINLRKFTKNRNKIDIKKQSNAILQDKHKIIISVIAILSIFFGCLLFKYNNDFGLDIVSRYITIYKSNNFLNLFLFLVKIEIMYFLLTFFIGTSAVGNPLVIFPPILKCLFIGFLSSYIYCEFKLKGIMMCLIILFPFYAASTSALIFACDESVYMSTYILKLITKKNTADDITIKLYLIRLLILFVIDIICVLINSIIVTIIIQKFNFL